jgi:hypothetical protein
MDSLTRDQLNDYWREACEERAAIREHDGGLPRPVAEAAALTDVNRALTRSGPTARQMLRLAQAGYPAIQVRQMSRRQAGLLVGRLPR